jgi:SAM-dependent methyltransferase
MAPPTYDQAHWEQLWQRTLRDHGDKVAGRAPNAHLVAAVAGVAPGRALDAGCGHGAEAIWLAVLGWQVTAVDFSASALGRGRSMAEALGADVARRITWVEADLGAWAPPGRAFDLVASLYVHVAGPVEPAVHRLAEAVTVGGTLLLVGHQPVDPATGAATPAAGQVQIDVRTARAVLDPEGWALLVAEERRRAVAATGVDAVIWARRLR